MVWTSKVQTAPLFSAWNFGSMICHGKLLEGIKPPDCIPKKVCNIERHFKINRSKAEIYSLFVFFWGLLRNKMIFRIVSFNESTHFMNEHIPTRRSLTAVVVKQKHICLVYHEQSHHHLTRQINSVSKLAYDIHAAHLHFCLWISTTCPFQPPHCSSPAVEVRQIQSQRQTTNLRLASRGI